MVGIVGRLWRRVWLLSSWLLLACSQPPVPSDTSWQVKAVAPLERYGRFATIEGEEQASLWAARNEHEGFQFIVRAGAQGAAGVSVAISPLRHASGAALPPAQVFRQRFVRVSTPSPYSPYPPQDWPDILLPADNPATPQLAADYRAFPQDLAAGENLPVWVDVFVPPDAPAGLYHGQVTVTAAGLPPLHLPVALQVWGFALPERSPLRTAFGTNGFTVAEMYGFRRQDNVAAHNRIIRAYNDFLLDHYLAPESLWDATPEADAAGRPDFAREVAGLGDVTANMRHYMQTKHAPAYTLVFADSYPFADPLGKDRAKAQVFIREYAAWCRRHAGAGRCYTDPSFVDEPDSAAAYQQVRAWGQFFDAIPPVQGEPIRFQVSEPPIPDDPAWGSLVGKVDVWVAKFYDLWRDIEYLKRNEVSRRVAAGEEVWAYTSLVVDFAAYRQLNPRADPLQGNYPPVWQLDFPPINYRLPVWLFHRYGVTGLGYWDTLASLPGSDVWQDAASFVSQSPPGIRFNGDGLLVYPGFRSRVGFDGPVASLRLKWLREAVEDYMYLDLLHQAGEGAWAQQQVAQVARHFGDWDNDPSRLLQIRRNLGERLHALHTQREGKP